MERNLKLAVSRATGAGGIKSMVSLLGPGRSVQSRDLVKGRPIREIKFEAPSPDLS